MSSNKDEKKIEVVSGNGENLEISPVSNYVPASKPKTNSENQKKVVIPKGKNK